MDQQKSIQQLKDNLCQLILSVQVSSSTEAMLTQTRLSSTDEAHLLPTCVSSTENEASLMQTTTRVSSPILTPTSSPTSSLPPPLILDQVRVQSLLG